MSAHYALPVKPANIVEDFSVPNNGTTDASARLSAVASSSLTDLYVPAGTYKISSAVTIPKGKVLRFAPGAVLEPDSGVTLTVNCTVVAGLWQVFGGAGAIAGVLDVKRVYPHWFGATGNGVTDDSAAIQAAINVLGSFGTLRIPAGTYIYSSVFNLATVGIRISGTGTLQKASGSDCHTFYITAANVRVKGLTINGNVSGQTTLDSTNTEVYVNATTGARIEGMTIENSAGDGITLAGSSQCYVRGNTVTAPNGNGIFAAGVNTDDNWIIDNEVTNTATQDGIFLTASPGSTATSNYIYNNRVINNRLTNIGDSGIESGIHTVGTIIAGNHVIGSKAAAILMRDAQNIVVIGNRVDQTNAPTGSNPDGISFFGQLGDVPEKRSSVIGNALVSNGTRYGIYLADGGQVTVSGNTVTDFTRNYYIAVSDHLIIDNQSICTSNSYSHLSLDENGTTNCNNVTVKGLKMTGGTDGIVLTNKTISGLYITGNPASSLAGSLLNQTGSSIGADPSYLYGNHGGTITGGDVFVRAPEGISGPTMPNTQYANITIASSTDVGMFVLRSGTTYAIGYVTAGAVTLTSNSSNIVSGLSGTSGWAIGVDTSTGAIILQFRGATTTTQYPFTLSQYYS